MAARGLLDNPIFDAMESGAVKWGNLMMNVPKRRTTQSKSRSKTRTHSALRNFKTPPLRLRADIYKTFPVIVNEISPNLFVIKWHRDNLRAWKEKNPTTWDEYHDYSDWTEARLIHSLKRHSSLYQILPPIGPDEIVRFRMIGSHPSAHPSHPSAHPPHPPKLMRLNDITGNYPVIWHRVEGARTTYAIEVRGDFMRRSGASEVAAMSHALLEDLRRSPSWVVIPPMGRGEVARIQMR